MKLSEVVKALEHIKAEYGDIEVQLQSNPKAGEKIVAYESFFIVPEKYDDPREWRVNIRSWPC